MELYAYAGRTGTGQTMRRRKQDPFKQNIISLLRQGRRTDAIAMVRDTLEKTPNHAAANQEWKRLQQGLPFSFEETLQRQSEKIRRQLEAILTDFARNPAQIAGLSVGVIKKKLKHVQSVVDQVGGADALQGTLAEQYQMYVAALTKERGRRKKNRRGKSLLWVGVLAGMGLLGLSGMAVVHRANVAADKLEDAWRHREKQPDVATAALHTYDTGFNRMLNRRVGHAADRIAHRVKNQYARLARAHALLNDIYNGKGKLAELSIEQRVEILQLCRLQSKQSAPVIKLWNILYLREKDRMESLQSSQIAELLEPLPPMPALSGIPKDDLPIIDQRMQELKQKLKRFTELNALYKLEKENVKSFSQELERLKLAKSELKKLHSCLHTLSAAQSYATYREMLEKRPATQHYPVAPSLQISVKDLPAQQDFLLDMQQQAAPGVPPELIPAVIRTLVYGGSTISDDCPANREQLQTMENIFALSGASVVLYQLINEEGEVCYAEEPPEIKEKEVIFRRSVYDPLRDTGDIRPVTWKDPSKVWIKPVDVRALWKACGFDAPQDFFNHARFPAILSSILNTEDRNCPVLARAYLYQKISELMRQQVPPAMIGIGFAPTMEKHLDDFEQLRKKLHVNLTGMCWVRHTPRLAAAEIAFTRWFREHRGAEYEKEIEDLVSEKLLLKAEYCGYVNEYGKPIYSEKPEKGATVSYADKKEIRRYQAGEEPAQLPPLSPLFVAKRVYKQQYQP